MDLKTIECVSSSKGTDVEDIRPNNLVSKPEIKVVKQSSPAPAKNVHKLLECPQCNISMRPPIYQCGKGHTLCASCKVKVHDQCPTCKQDFGGDFKCLALEKVTESVEIRPYPCPYACSECAVVGDIPSLLSHLRDFHKVEIHSRSEFTHRYVLSKPLEVDRATWILTVFQCFGKYFCIHFEAFVMGNAPVYIAFLRFMGDEKEALSYGYSLEVGGERIKLKWEGTPRSIRDSHVKVRNSYDGLIVQRKMALSFSGGDRNELKLRVMGEIWKNPRNGVS